MITRELLEEIQKTINKYLINVEQPKNITYGVMRQVELILADMDKERENHIAITDYEPDGTNRFFNIDDLPFTDDAKRMVLEWFARKLWVLLEEGSGNSDYYGKMYDPLVIEGNTAHSYVFDFEDGGRHHPFKDLAHLEKMLLDEGIAEIRRLAE